MEHLSKQGVGTFRVVCLASTSEDCFIADLNAAGFASFSLDSTLIADKESFLKEITRSCNLTPADLKLKSWDATSDLLWQKLMEQPDYKVAIIWRNAHLMVNGRLQLLLDCLEFLLGVAEIVERQEVSAECHPVLLRVVLIGDGNNFQLWK